MFGFIVINAHLKLCVSGRTTHTVPSGEASLARQQQVVNTLSAHHPRLHSAAEQTHLGPSKVRTTSTVMLNATADDECAEFGLISV
jgi:hypothetical protein